MESESDINSQEDELEEVINVKGKGKGKATNKGVVGIKKELPIKRRSSKACDNCRKSKCKCTRPEEDPTSKCNNCTLTGSECTYLGQSRKRGPPKGYIEAIESRLHRMEALMGTLLSSDDPRAQILLGELIGNEEAREVLAKDLNLAAANNSVQRKSWQNVAPSPASTSTSTQIPPIQISHGFNVNDSFEFMQQPSDFSIESPMHPPSWFTDEDLGMNSVRESSVGSSGSAPHGIFSNTNGFDTATAFTRRPGEGESFSTTTSLLGIDIPVNDSNTPNGTMNPRLSISQESTNSTLPRSQQRRKLNSPTHNSPTYLTSAGQSFKGGFTGTTTTAPIGSFAFQSQTKLTALPSPNAIAHTGQSVYSLTSEAELNHSNEVEDGGMTELGDVIGQLSLNENSEVRYHGRSSGLYLISKSTRYKDFFWQFPSAGVWPQTNDRVLKSEKELLQVNNLEDALPDTATQQHLLDLYWCYVHPHFPILYKVSFMRQYRHTLSNPESTEPSTPSGTGRVPVVLLLAMFSLAARYSNLKPTEINGKVSTAGSEYLERAKIVLNYDYGSSKLVTVQALLLLAYRDIGVGEMSSSWIFTGMAIRMAQDLGLFRDVEKWFLPVQKFSHEEKQSRKRVWWGCIVLDRYTASYIGRPGNIHERDYDTSFPSEDEPDEHEQWRPLRRDGTDYSTLSKSGVPDEVKIRYPPTKAHTLSCFSAAGALAVLINRIIANIYAIRTRVLGQSSETLLTLLDQSLASWYIGLPAHLAYTPNSKKVPPPHVLSLHLQFYSTLILLHRPFIPGQNSAGSPTSFPSHSICTTSAHSIANILTTFSNTFTLSQCPPFMIFPCFSAAIMFVYNTGFEESLARPARIHLKSCMDALKEMEIIWGSAMRQRELLTGLVDLNSDFDASMDEGIRGTKRSADVDVTTTEFVSPSTTFHRAAGRSGSLSSNAAKPRRRSSSLRSEIQPEVESPNPSFFAIPSLPVSDQSIPINDNEIFNFSLLNESNQQQTFDILNSAGGNIDISQFRSPPGTSGGIINYADLLNSFLAPGASMNDPIGNTNSTIGDTVDSSSAAFFGMEEWQSYLPQPFNYPPDQGSL